VPPGPLVYLTVTSIIRNTAESNMFTFEFYVKGKVVVVSKGFVNVFRPYLPTQQEEESTSNSQE
jgi:hypothetical protein